MTLSGVMIPVAVLFCFLVSWIFGGFAAFMGALLTVVPLAAGAIVSSSKVKAKTREIQPALDAAWMAAASDVIASSDRALAPRDLAARLGIDEAKAEELLALADVQASIGGAHQRTNEMASFDQRLRVATERADASGGGARVADAELEAAAEAEADAAARAGRQSRRS